MTRALKKLVIVESPAKAKTIEKFLGRGYAVKASLGHVRDLPKSRLGVDVEHEFEPSYVVPKEKKEFVKELAQEARNASELLLATDPDREGEAIAWHLTQAIGTRARPVKARRIVFHEITRNAVQEALKHPRAIDGDLVNAQQARRVLDRLVGYKLSPLLWHKVKKGLSAGRVQSVAVRLVVDREREIDAFQAEEYWTVEALLRKQEVHQGPAGRVRGLPPGAQRGAPGAEGRGGRHGRRRGPQSRHVQRGRGAQARGQPRPQRPLHHQHPAAGGRAAPAASPPSAP